MKLFYSYMWHLFAHIPTLSRVFRIPLKIFSPANQWHRLVMSGTHLFLIFCFIVFSLNDARPQSPVKSGTVSGSKAIKPLLVGQQVPDEFWTKEHLFYVNGDTVRRSLKEYKGKLLVLDFWATWCAICLAQMKDTETLFNKFPDEANLLFINPNQTKDKYSTILKMKDNLSQRSLSGNFTSVIEDDLIQQLFPNHIYPRYVWISPYGNLMALTTSLSVTEGHLGGILKHLKRFNYGTD